MTISGTSAIYLMLADPIGQVRSPVLINEMFAHEGIDAVMVPLNVAADGIDDFWVGLKRLKNVRGLIVSVPFKAAARRLSDRAGPHATLIGTANAVRREADGSFTCENFDGLGFVAALKKSGHDIAGRRALLAGAGGAGSAIAFVLASEGTAVLTIADAETDRAKALAAAVSRAYPKVRAAAGPADPEGHDLVVNATPMGMKPEDPFPLAVQNLNPAMTVMDIVMKPRETALLARAREIGCPVQYGAAMTDSQMDLWVDFLGLRGAKA